MGRFNFEAPKFKEFLNKNAENIAQIVSDEIIDSSKFSIFRSRFIEKLWIDVGSKEYIITIDKEELLQIDLGKIYEEFREKIKISLSTDNKFVVNKSLDILVSENVTEDLVKHCEQLSNTNYCTFLLNNHGIIVFLNGKKDVKSTIFFNDQDVRSYTSRLDIRYIDQIFKEYKDICLIDKHIFIHNEDEYLLIPKPKERMKKHLTRFLNSRLAYTFNTNIRLSDSDIVFDISTEVDGKFYFFVIEWIGKSVEENNDKDIIIHDDHHARSSFSTLLEYIKKLEENSTKVDTGVLVVYDARKDCTDINYCDFSFIRNELIKYFPMAKKYDDLRICS